MHAMHAMCAFIHYTTGPCRRVDGPGYTESTRELYSILIPRLNKPSGWTPRDSTNLVAALPETRQTWWFYLLDATSLSLL